MFQLVSNTFISKSSEYSRILFVLHGKIVSNLIIEWTKIWYSFQQTTPNYSDRFFSFQFLYKWNKLETTIRYIFASEDLDMMKNKMKLISFTAIGQWPRRTIIQNASPKHFSFQFHSYFHWFYYFIECFSKVSDQHNQSEIWSVTFMSKLLFFVQSRFNSSSIYWKAHLSFHSISCKGIFWARS